MSLTSRELADVVAELQPLVGGFVQKLHVSEPRTVFFELRQPGASHLLLVGAETGRTRLHVASGRPPAPEPPLPFQAVLRAELMGLALEAIEAQPGERLARLRFAGHGRRWLLVAELTGRHGNLFLLDEAGVVRGMAVRNLSQVRDNRLGQPYVPLRSRPATAPGEDSSRFGEEASAAAVPSTRALPDRGARLETARGEDARFSPPSAAAVPSARSPLDRGARAGPASKEPEAEPDARRARQAFPLSHAIEQAYEAIERAALVEARRTALTRSLGARRAQLQRTVERVREDFRRTEQADAHRRRGELLKRNLHLVRRGMTSVELLDYTESGVEPVTVRLDPALDPKLNLERSFHQYRRLSGARGRVQARLEALTGELAEVERRLAAAVALDEQALLAAGGAAAGSAGGAHADGSRGELALERPRQRGGRRPRLPFREYRLPSGQRIRVGRGARENDALTFRHSKGNDLWLHARGVAGAHVVVPLERAEKVRDDTLRDAALLAAQSSESHGDSVEVAYTQVKYVRKTRGSPGAVTYSQERSLWVRRDPTRLAQLQDAMVPDDGG